MSKTEKRYELVEAGLAYWFGDDGSVRSPFPEEIREELGELGDIKDPNVRGAGSCQEVCDLSDAICSSSSKICGISNAHPGESYFLDRCEWSQNECRSADQRCSVCDP